MSQRPYDTPAFQHAAEYTITLTFVVAGGKRRGTAERHAKRVAERLANHAARLADVVEVVAVGGVSYDGKPHAPYPIRFAAANTGPARPGDGRLARYVDPERDRALRALKADNAEAKAREDADRRRRTALGCRNAHRSMFLGQTHCACAYCRPEDHLTALRRAEHGDDDHRFVRPRCLCGQRVALPGQCCIRHGDARLVLLDGDLPALQLLADHVPTS